MLVVTAQQMKELDQRTIRNIGLPGTVLMENAGRATFEQIRRCFPKALQRRVLVLCGRGNNGGDGFVIARYCLNAGAEVSVFLAASRDSVGGDARINLEAFQNMGGSIQEITQDEQWAHARGGMRHAGLIVDALLGTGLASEVRGLIRCMIDEVNTVSGIPVVSVDIPSGVDATTGSILGTAVRARLTCTFGLPKRGLLVYPGLSCVGDLEVVDIGIPRQLMDGIGINEYLLDRPFFRNCLPPRRPDAHKGSFGHVLVIAGSPGKTGAAAMTAQAAMRAGAGLVTAGVPRQLNAVLESKLTEPMTEPLSDFGDGFLGSAAWPELQELMLGKSVLALGPGLGNRDETRALVRNVIQSSSVTLIVDADGLNALAGNTDMLCQAKAPLILTPHPGEMARLMETTAADIQHDRVGHARAFAQRSGAIVVLKGARTLIADPRGGLSINPTGNPGMACGGMGDVLTGMIAGLAAQGMAPLKAAQLAVYVHGAAADAVAREGARLGILATDLLDRIPEALTAVACMPDAVAPGADHEWGRP